jgi:multiple sugar transport system substrate-binding protein
VIRSGSRVAAFVAALAIVVGACGGGATPSPASSASPAPSQGTGTSPSPAPSIDTTPVTITVWDYYGMEVTPFTTDALAAFKTEYPWITVDRQDLDWDTFLDKFNVAVSSGEGPDLATLDMTWIPTLASNGALLGLKAISGGVANGQPITDIYADGPIEAMTYGDDYVTMMYDFDAYALYYRSDLFEQKGITVPTTWDELRAAAKQLAEDSDGDGKLDKYLYALRPNTFHYSQFLFQNGGQILSDDLTEAAFNDDAGVGALQFQMDMATDGTGLYWSDADGDLPPAIVDGRVAMFSDGPYYMGLLKSGVPDQSGKWKVAVHPYSVQQGSYLGGTGLSIPTTSKHQQAAWLLAEFMLRPEQQIGVYTVTGAAPATLAALNSPELTQPDDYFGGQKPFEVFLEVMSSATHFPYVGQWSKIDEIIGENLDAALVGTTDAQSALDAAAAAVNDELAQ